LTDLLEASIHLLGVGSGPIAPEFAGCVNMRPEKAAANVPQATPKRPDIGLANPGYFGKARTVDLVVSEELVHLP